MTGLQLMHYAESEVSVVGRRQTWLGYLPTMKNVDFSPAVKNEPWSVQNRENPSYGPNAHTYSNNVSGKTQKHLARVSDRLKTLYCQEQITLQTADELFRVNRFGVIRKIKVTDFIVRI